jgi:cell shape-determining protein MreC
MIYSQKSNKNKKVFVLGIFLIIIFLIFRGFFSRISFSLLSPAMKVYESFSSKFSFGLDLLRPKGSLVAENESLKRRIAELEMQNLEMGTQSEFGNLSEEAGFVLVSPISFPPRVPYDTLVIDKGEDGAVKTGDKVYLAGRIIVGVVEGVSGKVSTVRLFTSSGIKTEAVLERTGEVVELEGVGGQSFVLKLPAGFDITPEDIFVLPGKERIVVAKVLSIEKDENSSFMKIFSSLPFKINGNTELYVQL